MNTIFKPTDFTLAGKDTYISQRAIERMFDLADRSIKRQIIDKMPQVIINEFNQLHAKSLVIAAQHYATKGNKYAIKLLCDIATAGAVAYIYHLAGDKLIPESEVQSRVDSKLEDIKLEKLEAELLRLRQANKEIEQENAAIEAETAEMEQGIIEIQSRSALSATVLLRQTGSTLRRITFFRMLEEANMLERIKPPKLNDNGLKYGHNLPFGDGTQPRWYKHRFIALLKALHTKG